MSRVIRGTGSNNVGIVKSQHVANIKKMRCQGCKVGYAVQVETSRGNVYRCNRCGREYNMGEKF